MAAVQPVLFKLHGPEVKFNILSNLYACPVLFLGATFPSAEHAYQYCKLKFFGHNDTADKVFSCCDAMQCKQLGSSVNVPSAKWRKVNALVMRCIVHAKFGQNTKAREVLLGTGKRPIYEVTGGGWGVHWDCKQCQPTAGENKMGEVLMRVRAEMLGEVGKCVVAISDSMARNCASGLPNLEIYSVSGACLDPSLLLLCEIVAGNPMVERIVVLGGTNDLAPRQKTGPPSEEESRFIERRVKRGKGAHPICGMVQRTVDTLLSRGLQDKHLVFLSILPRFGDSVRYGDDPYCQKRAEKVPKFNAELSAAVNGWKSDAIHFLDVFGMFNCEECFLREGVEHGDFTAKFEGNDGLLDGLHLSRYGTNLLEQMLVKAATSDLQELCQGVKGKAWW